MTFNFPINPCLYCDSEQLEYKDGQVVCNRCLARGPMERTDAEAILAWNTLGNTMAMLLGKRNKVRGNITQG